jgi:aryl-alcohol dehydrogenase-like predicted oxidoreductase
MQLRHLGRSQLEVSGVGLGTNNFGARIDAAASTRVVHAALDQGVTLFDTANTYGAGRSERFLGAALGDRRGRALIATKFGMRVEGEPADSARGSRAYIRWAVERSLERLGTDYIDLYQMHRPDPLTPIEETLGALNELVREGKVRHLGSSNFAGWQIADADWLARMRGWTRFISAQNLYSLLERGIEREVIPACQHFGIGVLPFFPLASGLLTGKYRRGHPPPPGTRLATRPNAAEILSERNFTVVEALEHFAQARDIALLAVAIGGLAAQPCVASVIAGATTPEQVAANVAAAAWVPSAEDLLELQRLTG